MPEQFAAVEPHGNLQKIIDDVWFLTGSIMLKPLIRLPRNMVVIRNNGELTLINSVRLDDKSEAALDALGKVTHVMKIGFHGQDDPYYLHRYGAKYWSVVQPAMDGAATITEETELPFPGATTFMFKETNTPEAAILIERDGGLLITCDSVQHWVAQPVMSFMAKIVTRFIGFQKKAQIGPPWRKVQTPEGGSLLGDFERLLTLDFDRLIGGHGGLLEKQAKHWLDKSVRRELS